MDSETRLPERVVNGLTTELASVPTLRLPAKLTQNGATSKEKQDYLSALLRHDPGVFLERHGDNLSTEQRSSFEPLRESSYEVDFYMKVLEDKQVTNDSGKESPLIGATERNRRLAKMARLAKEGYFDEEAARKRAPLLHHQYLGQYNRPKAVEAKPNALHDQILEQHEEREIAERMEAERKQEDIAAAAFEATISESESESDNEKDLDIDMVSKPGHEKPGFEGTNAAEAISFEELQQNQEDFRAIMEAKFLSGEDGGREADNDSSLDDDWAKEITQDREDEYFES